MASEALEHLRKDLDNLIKQFQNESNKHKSLYRNLRYLAFTFTGCSTIMSSLALTFKEAGPWLNIGVVLATVSVGVITSIEGIRKPSELWIQERNVFHALEDLRRELEFKAKENPDKLNLDDWFSRMQSILTASTEKWTSALLGSQNRGKTE
jgi:Protein of unknown function (DUF4231)